VTRLLCIAIVVLGCARQRDEPAPRPAHARGELQRIEPIKGYTADDLRGMLGLAGLPVPIPVTNGVDLYRIIYWTELRGQPELASGLYVRPRDVAVRATTVWMMPTNPTRKDAPSMGSQVGLIVSAAFAANGFVLVAPDYIGLGVSTTYHPYFDAASIAAAAVDMIRAVRDAAPKLGAWEPKTVITGFSEGGYATAVVQRALEAAPEPGVDVRAAAAIAPPLELAELSVPHAFENKSASDTMYLAFLAHAYARTYGHPLDSLLTADAAKLVTTLFDGLHDDDDIAAKLPKNPREIFRPEAIASLTENKPSWFRDALVANDAFNWAPKAPLRLYYGDSDNDVFPDDPKAAAAAMKALGGNVELMPVGAFDHTQTALHALPLVIAWFQQVSRPAG
jgi:pimeloyl-ACP methyl ester carboxylesterase